MNRLLLCLIFMATLSTTSDSQSLQDDITIVYMKGNVLYDQGRYDEAIRFYNRVLKEDPAHANALYMRAKTKYELGAYKGTKIDALKHIETNGVTKNLIKLMAQTEIKLDHIPAAANYVFTALELDPYDGSMHFLNGQIALEYGNKNEACESYARASILGFSKATREVNKLCGGISDWIDIPKDVEESTNHEVLEEVETQKSDTSDTHRPPSNDTMWTPASIQLPTHQDTVLLDESTDNHKSDETPHNSDTEPNNIPQEDLDASQELIIDENLTLVFTNGIGKRKIDRKPNIFLLSNQDGLVVIDICISRTGKVTEAEFNRKSSTLFRTSLTSLALRKIKEFEFMPSLRDEQCGTVIYKIRS